jgi:hypothetical protein
MFGAMNLHQVPNIGSAESDEVLNCAFLLFSLHYAVVTFPDWLFVCATNVSLIAMLQYRKKLSLPNLLKVR